MYIYSISDVALVHLLSCGTLQSDIKNTLHFAGGSPHFITKYEYLTLCMRAFLADILSFDYLNN